MTTRACQDFEEQLAAYAAGGLDGRELGEVQGHLEGCRACRDEVSAIGQVLSRTRAAIEPRPVMDEAFWRDFSQKVSSACDQVGSAPSRPFFGGGVGILAWLRRPLVVGGFCAVAAAVLLFAYVKKPQDLARAPLISTSATPSTSNESAQGARPVQHPAAHHVVRPASRVVVEDDDAMEDLTAAQLTAVLHSFEPADDDAPDEDTLAARPDAAGPAEALEGLSDEELARVYAAL